jgi:hypothetical protein
MEQLTGLAQCQPMVNRWAGLTILLIADRRLQKGLEMCFQAVKESQCSHGMTVLNPF